MLNGWERRVFFTRRGIEGDQPVGFNARADEPLPVLEIAKHFQLFPQTINWDLRGTLAEVRRRKHVSGSAAAPFQVLGVTDLYPGYTAELIPWTGGERHHVRVVSRLYMSDTTAVYRVTNSNDEELVFKLVLKFVVLPGILGTLLEAQEEPTLRSLTEARVDPGIVMPSLPEYVAFGTLKASGGVRAETCGDGYGFLLKPEGDCVRGKVFDPVHLCKAAFDLLLALYHLYLVERRHRAVKTENVLFVEKQNQFVLVDFKLAYTECLDYGDTPDCHQLVRCLVEMSGKDGNCSAEAACENLAASAPLLGRFATYAFTLRSAKAIPEYRYWLQELATACGVHVDALATMMKKVYF